MGSRRIACPEATEHEPALVAGLEKVASWRIVGHHFELYDDNGELLARLEARYME